MFPFHETGKAPQFALRALSLAAAFALLTNCASSSIRISDAVHEGDASVFLSGSRGSSPFFFTYEKGALSRQSIAGVTSPADRIFRTGNVTVMTTEHDGIFVSAPSHLSFEHVPVGSGAIIDETICDVYIDTAETGPEIYITYLSAAGSGVTVCTVPPDQKLSCRQMTKANSGLKSDYVRQVLRDASGSLWFRYSPNEAIGVSRLAPGGGWTHYSTQNSNVGGNDVSVMRADDESEGFPGVNMWFVSSAGLSRFSCGEKEEWFFYGDKNTFINKVTQAIGIQSWFTDAIIDIVDIAFTRNSVMIANKYALFDFSEKNVERFIPETTGGIDDLRISGMTMLGGNVFVEVRPYRVKNPPVRHFMVYSPAGKKWTDVRYWKLHSAHASGISVVAYDAAHDLVLFRYPDGETSVALLSREDHSLQPVAVAADEGEK